MFDLPSERRPLPLPEEYIHYKGAIRSDGLVTMCSDDVETLKLSRARGGKHFPRGGSPFTILRGHAPRTRCAFHETRRRNIPVNYTDDRRNPFLRFIELLGLNRRES